MPIEYPIPKLFEAIQKDNDIKQDLPGIFERSKSNPMINAVMREAILSDVSGALGKLHDSVVEAAKPALIGRELIWVMPTSESMVRFPKAKVGKAKRTAELAQTWIYGEKYSTIDVKTNIEIRAGAEYSKKFFEDATWPVMERQAAEVGRSIAELETERILALYESIPASDLAGGAVLNGSGTLDWAGVVSFWNQLKKENLSAKVLAINPNQAADLWQDEKFIHSFYFGDKVDVARGILGQSYLGMKVAVSTKVADGTVFAIDTDVAGVMPLRRDVMTEPFENPRDDRYGIVGSERLGLGVLKTEAVARGTGW
ncbi:MAG: hypothetical protein NUK63_03315 [Candidatus Bathyarchaeum tardum]|nr:MAG: hypothetical protein NUK63_03315 [Candidatus Bathyarchaeum tardum]